MTGAAAKKIRKKNRKQARCQARRCGKVRVGHSCNENIGDGSWNVWICDQCLNKRSIKRAIREGSLEVC